MLTDTTLELPTWTWLAVPSLPPQPSAISFMVLTVGTDVKSQAFPSFRWHPSPTHRPPVDVLQPPTNSALSRASVCSLSLFLSHSPFCFLALALLPTLPCPCLCPVNTVSPVCS